MPAVRRRSAWIGWAACALLPGCAGHFEKSHAPADFESGRHSISIHPSEFHRASAAHPSGARPLAFASLFADLPIADDDGAAAAPMGDSGDAPLFFVDAIYRALHANPDISAARHIPEQARAAVDGVRAVYDPEAFAEWQYAMDRDMGLALDSARLDRRSVTQRAGIRQHLPTGGRITVYREWIDGREWGSGRADARMTVATNVLELRQPLLRGSLDRDTRARLRMARLEAEASEQDFQGVFSDVAAAAGEAYWHLAGAMEEVRIAKETLFKAAAVHEREMTRQEDGFLSILDVERAIEAASAREVDLLRAEENMAILRERLGYLMGLESGEAAWLALAEPVDAPAF